MICYAAHTTGATNRGALAAAGWGMLCSAAYRWRDDEWRSRARGGIGLALDNGAFSSYNQGLPFDAAAFMRAVESQDGPDAMDFIVCPDAVMDADGTRAMRDLWLPWLIERTAMVLLPVQDGMDDDDLPLSLSIGIFVGGSDAWKERTIKHWADRAHDAGAWCHVGRVNSQRRLQLCRAGGADSIDGSGPARFSKHLAVMERGRKAAAQVPMWWGR